MSEPNGRDRESGTPSTPQEPVAASPIVASETIRHSPPPTNPKTKLDTGWADDDPESLGVPSGSRSTTTGESEADPEPLVVRNAPPETTVDESRDESAGGPGPLGPQSEQPQAGAGKLESDPEAYQEPLKAQNSPPPSGSNGLEDVPEIEPEPLEVQHDPQQYWTDKPEHGERGAADGTLKEIPMPSTVDPGGPGQSTPGSQGSSPTSPSGDQWGPCDDPPAADTSHEWPPATARSGSQWDPYGDPPASDKSHQGPRSTAPTGHRWDPYNDPPDPDTPRAPAPVPIPTNVNIELNPRLKSRFLCSLGASKRERLPQSPDSQADDRPTESQRLAKIRAQNKHLQERFDQIQREKRLLDEKERLLKEEERKSLEMLRMQAEERRQNRERKERNMYSRDWDKDKMPPRSPSPTEIDGHHGRTTGRRGWENDLRSWGRRDGRRKHGGLPRSGGAGGPRRGRAEDWDHLGGHMASSDQPEGDVACGSDMNANSGGNDDSLASNDGWGPGITAV